MCYICATYIETKFFRIKNIIFNQVFVQTFIHYALKYFEEVSEQRYWYTITYIATAIFKSSGKAPFSVEKLNRLKFHKNGSHF